MIKAFRHILQMPSYIALEFLTVLVSLYTITGEILVSNKNTYQIISIINQYDNKEWKEKILSKSTLSIYNEYK